MNKNKKLNYSSVYEKKFNKFREIINANKLYMGRQQENPHNIVYDFYKNGKLTEDGFLLLSNSLINYQYYILSELANNPNARINFNTIEPREDFSEIENYFATLPDIE